MNNKQTEVAIMNKKQMHRHTFGRIIKTLFQAYPVLIPFIILCIIFGAVVAAIPDVILPGIIDILKAAIENKTSFDTVLLQIRPYMTKLIILYITALSLNIIQTQLLAYVTQGYLAKIREKMFNKMQDLPLSFFDQNKHGDIMSYYTNDIDTLRRLVPANE